MIAKRLITSIFGIFILTGCVSPSSELSGITLLNYMSSASTASCAELNQALVDTKAVQSGSYEISGAGVPLNKLFSVKAHVDSYTAAKKKLDAYKLISASAQQVVEAEKEKRCKNYGIWIQRPQSPKEN